MRLIRIFVTSSAKQLKNDIYVSCWDAEYKSLYKTFLQSPQEDDSSMVAQLHLPNITGSGKIDGSMQFGTRTFYTLVVGTLVGHDTLFVTVSIQLMLLHLIRLEIEDTRLVTLHS